MSEEITQELTKYEVMAIITPDVTSAAYKKHVDDIKELIKSHKGSIWHEEEWGKRELAYPIKKHDHGHYVIVNFDMPSEEAMEFQKQLRLMGAVLRFLVVKTPLGYEPQKYNLEETVKVEKPKEAPVKRVAKVAPTVVVKEIPVEVEEPAEEREEDTSEEPTKETEEETAEEPEKKSATEDVKKHKKEMTDKESTERLNKLDEKLEELLSGDDDLNL